MIIKLLGCSLFLLSLLFPLLSAASDSKIQPEFIIDTDMGIDDVIAIAYLLNDPTIKIKAITVAGNGNVHCQSGLNNLKSLLSFLKRSEIPIACGRADPFPGGHKFPAKTRIFFDNFLADLLPSSAVKNNKNDARNLIKNILGSTRQPINIIVLGPMTNLADVILTAPHLKNKIKKIYAMGGAIYVQGNIKTVDKQSINHVAEWNIYFDPYAAKIVFSSGVPLVLVPLDATNFVPITQEFFERLANHRVTPAANFTYSLLKRYKKKLLDEKWHFWDPLTAVIATSPNLGEYQFLPLSVKLKPESLAGKIYVNDKNSKIVQVYLKVDKNQFEKQLLKNLN